MRRGYRVDFAKSALMTPPLILGFGLLLVEEFEAGLLIAVFDEFFKALNDSPFVVIGAHLSLSADTLGIAPSGRPPTAARPLAHFAHRAFT